MYLVVIYFSEILYSSFKSTMYNTNFSGNIQLSILWALWVLCMYCSKQYVLEHDQTVVFNYCVYFSWSLYSWIRTNLQISHNHLGHNIYRIMSMTKNVKRTGVLYYKIKKFFLVCVKTKLHTSLKRSHSLRLLLTCDKRSHSECSPFSEYYGKEWPLHGVAPSQNLFSLCCAELCMHIQGLSGV